MLACWGQELAVLIREMVKIRQEPAVVGRGESVESFMRFWMEVSCLMTVTSRILAEEEK